MDQTEPASAWLAQETVSNGQIKRRKVKVSTTAHTPGRMFRTIAASASSIESASCSRCRPSPIAHDH